MKSSELMDSLLSKGYEVRRDLVNCGEYLVFKRLDIEWVFRPTDDPWATRYDLADVDLDGPSWRHWKIERMEESDV